MDLDVLVDWSSSKSLAGLLGYTDLPLVSSDFRGDSRSSIVDGLMTTVLSEENMVHIVGCMTMSGVMPAALLIWLTLSVKVSIVSSAWIVYE